MWINVKPIIPCLTDVSMTQDPKWNGCTASKGETVRKNNLLSQVVLQIYSSIVDKHGNLFKI